MNHISAAGDNPMLIDPAGIAPQKETIHDKETQLKRLTPM
jgi:hypothetical protein